MRILIVSPEEEEVGGVQNVIGNLSRYLRSRGHDVVFLYTSKESLTNKRVNSQGFTAFDLNLQLPFGERPAVISLFLFLIRFPIGLFQLLRILRTNRIQIVNVHYPAETASYFALCRHILSFGLVTSVHGADLFPGGKPKAEYSREIRYLLNCSDRIIAPSQAYRNEVATLFQSLDAKIESIHNGVNFNELAAPSDDSNKEASDQYVLCVAMLNEKKGQDVLLRAFALTLQSAPHLKLALVGDGPLREELEALALSLGISDSVRFHGRKGRKEVAQLIQQCEIFVLPSRSEPFGIVLIEAMACAKPVIATKVGGIPEIVDGGKSGILVEPDNPGALSEALVTMLENPDLRISMANNGYYEVHRKFSSDAMGAAYEQLFGSIIQSGAMKN